MPSPFPGMDPYLEDAAFWPDFHPTFINYWREAIADLLPENYEARIGERVVLDELSNDLPKLIGPDVSTHQTSRESTDRDLARGGRGRPEPITIPLIILDAPRQAYIEILRRPERTLVAVLELQSPSNKSGPGRAEYIAKRNALAFQDVHLV